MSSELRFDYKGTYTFDGVTIECVGNIKSESSTTWDSTENVTVTLGFASGNTHLTGLFAEGDSDYQKADVELNRS